MRAIESAIVHRDPFPHMIVDDALPRNVLAQAVRRWPDKHMVPEPGGLNRRWVHLIQSNRLVPSLKCGPFWFWFALRYGRPLLRAVFEKFRPDCEAKNGAKDINIGQLVCFDAESEFVEHTPHSHWGNGPDWLFTVLIYIDDNGRTDRGTRLFREERDGAFSTAADTGFAPGRMLAFFEAQNAYHGSTPFQVGSGGRKILRAHVCSAAG
jgi:hypothetical protein